MKLGRSGKSGKRSWIVKHHIIPQRLNDDDESIVNLTPTEHAEIHELIKGIDDKQSIISITFHWLMNIGKGKDN